MNTKISHRWFGSLLLALAALGLSLSLVSTARAQSTTDGAISGTIYDQTGAVIPDASVVVHNNGTNLDQTRVTDASGFYIATKLTPAVYTVTVTAKGFETFRAEQVIVTVGSVTNVSPRMTVGLTTQTVSVSGVAPQINTTSADFANTLNQTAIANLPIQRPRWSNFALLTPGVVNDSNGFGLLSFRGVSTLLNGTSIDGADNLQYFFSEERGRTRISYSSTEVSIQEFQVNTSNYSAEYGGAAGGVINTVTKSGTNQMHGEIFYKNRENGWASRNPFATLTEQTSPGVFTPLPLKPKDYWDMWGFGIGGPIVKDKLFFFVAYDGFFRNFPGNAVANVPSAFFAAPSATTIKTMAQIINNLGCSASGCTGTPTAAQLATATTDYNNGFAGLTTLLGSNNRTGKQDILFPKLDWQINQKNRASFEVNRMRWASPYGVQTQVTNPYSNGSAFGNDYVKTTWGVAKLDTFISPTMVNEFRYQIGRDFEFETTPPPDPYEVNELQNTSATSTTYPSWTNYTSPFGIPDYVNVAESSAGLYIGAPYYDTRIAYPNELRSQFADTVTWSRGNHTMKFGGSLNHTNDQIKDIYEQNGYFSYSTVAAYLEDIYSPVCTGLTTPCATHYSSFTQSFGPLAFNFATNDVAIFAQDDWKVLPRFALSFGLRWEYERFPTPLYPNPAIPQTTQYPDYKKNFGPRIGFAWDVFGDGKMAVRGGFGLYYGRLTNGIIFGVLTQSGLYSSPGVLTGQPSYSFSSGAAGGPYLPEVLSTAPTSTAAPAVVYYNSHYKNPQIDSADFLIERNVGWNTVLSAAYMGTWGHFLPQTTDDNIVQGTNSGTAAAPNCAGAGGTLTYLVAGGGPIHTPTYTTPFYACRPNPGYAQMIDIFGVSSNYNALIIQATHRLSNSVQFNANYTWGHSLGYDPSAITTITASSGFGMLEPNNVGAEYSNTPFNVPERVVVNMVLNSPWHVDGRLGYLANGWQMSPIFSAQNGLPYSVSVSGSAPGLLSNGGGLNGADGSFRINPGLDTLAIPGTQNLDLRISKTIPIKEKVNLELMGEAFNLFNHYNATGVTSTAYTISKSGTIVDTNGATQTCGTGTGTSGPACLSYDTPFGSVTSANNNFAFSTRQIQIGLILKF
jgi:hypothetical protein